MHSTWLFWARLKYGRKCAYLYGEQKKITHTQKEKVASKRMEPNGKKRMNTQNPISVTDNRVWQRVKDSDGKKSCFCYFTKKKKTAKKTKHRKIRFFVYTQPIHTEIESISVQIIT